MLLSQVQLHTCRKVFQVQNQRNKLQRFQLHTRTHRFEIRLNGVLFQLLPLIDSCVQTLFIWPIL